MPSPTPPFETRLVDARQGLKEAAALLRAGLPVAMPTETVYGLAANALNAEAVARIFEAKGRPQDNPLIVHIAAIEDWGRAAREIPPEALKLAEAFWPGPLTIILPKSGALPPEVTAGLDTVGVRMPRHPVAAALIRESGLPLAAPSANASGRPSPTTAAHVLEDLDSRIPLILDGGPTEVGIESTVMRLYPQPQVLRPGAVSAAQLSEVLGREVAGSKGGEATGTPASPGMKYRHYAPKAKLVLVHGALPRFADYLKEQNTPGAFALCFEGEEAALPLPALSYGREGDEAAHAAALFAALRRLDAMGARVIYARPPGGEGVGPAVYERLLRAAAFTEIYL